MKTFDLEGTIRTSVGKVSTKQVRKDKMVPAVVYGLENPMHFTVDYNAMKKALFTPETYIFNLNLGGKTTKAVVKEAQYHPVTDHILHVDFMRITDDREVEVELPIRLVGVSPGVLAGGKLVPMLRYLRVKGLPGELPEAVEVNISKLVLGKTLKVNSVVVEGLNITSPGSAGVVAVEIPRTLKTEGVKADEEDEDGEEGGEGGEAGNE